MPPGRATQRDAPCLLLQTRESSVPLPPTYPRLEQKLDEPVLRRPKGQVAVVIADERRRKPRPPPKPKKSCRPCRGRSLAGKYRPCVTGGTEPANRLCTQKTNLGYDIPQICGGVPAIYEKLPTCSFMAQAAERETELCGHQSRSCAPVACGWPAQIVRDGLEKFAGHGRLRWRMPAVAVIPAGLRFCRAGAHAAAGRPLTIWRDRLKLPQLGFHALLPGTTTALRPAARRLRPMMVRFARAFPSLLHGRAARPQHVRAMPSHFPP